jgi:hypothetical protein
LPSATDLAAMTSLGVPVIRVEWDIQTVPTTMDATISAYAAKGVRVLALAGFDTYIPTTGQAQNLGTWATRFGPGGTFWANRTDQHLAIQHFEFGNETSYVGAGQFTGTVGDAAYIQRAKDYAARFKSAYDAIAATGKPVGLLCQTDDGGSSNSSWVDSMYVQVSDLHNYVSGWTVHPYGPTYLAKTTRCCVTYTANNGADAAIPIDITEVGISTDNGTDVGDNYGWSTTMSYSTAASTMATVMSTLRADSAVGPRLRHFLIYRVTDLQPPGTPAHREYYFGATKSDGTDKGAYSTQIRTVLKT